MQRERQGRNDFFAMGDPFGNFRGFGLMPSLFGGRDPFDDSLFTLPFGSMFESSRYDPPVLLAGTYCRPIERRR
jgi:myeloid leukemia factor 1